MQVNQALGLRPGRSRDTVGTPVGINVAAGVVVMVAAALAAALVPQSAPAARLGLMALALAAFASLAVDLTAVVMVGGLGYLIVNGFLVNGLGELSWHGAAEVWRLVALGAAALGGLGGGAMYRAARRARLWRLRREQVAIWAEEMPVREMPVRWDEEETHGA